MHPSLSQPKIKSSKTAEMHAKIIKPNAQTTRRWLLTGSISSSGLLLPPVSKSALPALPVGCGTGAMGCGCGALALALASAAGFAAAFGAAFAAAFAAAFGAGWACCCSSSSNSSS